MFQFDLGDLSSTHGAAPVVANLAEVFDGWALVCWFAWPKPCLGSRRPVDLLDSAPANVLSAARVAREARWKGGLESEVQHQPCLVVA